MVFTRKQLGQVVFDFVDWPPILWSSKSEKRLPSGVLGLSRD